MRKSKTAFTLIELSIVLVIIGLIVGGVLVGQDLIRTAQMKSIMDDWTRFEVARQTFYLKYQCLPGDCANASALGLGASGNGNKVVEAASVNAESWQYWLHLANVGLVEGTYTGAAGAGGATDAVINENAPSSKISGIGYIISSPFGLTWHNNVGLNVKDNDMFVVTGSDQHTGNSGTYGAKFTVTETYTFDQKFDDGLANNGRIRTHIDNANHEVTCTTGSAPDYSYDLNDTSGICNLLYK